MKDYPLVSVAVITYNQKEYLKECIESILAQDYPNIEIVIGDDGSTDGTQDMLKEYAKKYPKKFKLILSKKNEGITKNQNKVLSLCEGKYIAWMGGDDLMFPSKIRKQVEYMEKNPQCFICYHDLEVFDSETGRTIFIAKSKHKGDIRVLLKYGTVNGACSTMVRRSKIPKKGFDERVPLASDWLFWCEVLANGGTIEYISEVLGKHRRHNKNVTVKRRKEVLIDHLNSCNILLAKYPQYSNEIMYRYANLLYLLGKEMDSKYYSNFLKLSLKARFNVKRFLKLILYYLSFGRLKV